MASKVNRRRFLKNAGAGIAAGSAATSALSVAAAENAAGAPAIPVPDAQTKSVAGGETVPAECCSTAPKMIFACSGAADVGKIADLAARKLSEEGAGKMSCLAGVGGRVAMIMDAVKAAQTILVIDGCLQHCGRKTMKQADVTKFEHLSLHDMKLEKGKTPPTDEMVAKVANRAKTLLAQ